MKWYILAVNEMYEGHLYTWEKCKTSVSWKLKKMVLLIFHLCTMPWQALFFPPLTHSALITEKIFNFTKLLYLYHFYMSALCKLHNRLKKVTSLLKSAEHCISCLRTTFQHWITYCFARKNRNARVLSINHVKYFLKVSLYNKLS